MLSRETKKDIKNVTIASIIAGITSVTLLFFIQPSVPPEPTNEVELGAPKNQKKQWEIDMDTVVQYQEQFIARYGYPVQVLSDGTIVMENGENLPFTPPSNMTVDIIKSELGWSYRVSIITDGVSPTTSEPILVRQTQTFGAEPQPLVEQILP